MRWIEYRPDMTMIYQVNARSLDRDRRYLALLEEQYNIRVLMGTLALLPTVNRYIEILRGYSKLDPTLLTPFIELIWSGVH